MPVLISSVQEISLPVTTRTTCNDFINYLFNRGDNPVNYIGYICVGDGQANGGCYGDSGGPVIVQKQGETR